MGLFFLSRNNESTKPVIVIRILMVMMMGILLAWGIINGSTFYFLRLIFIIAGLVSIVDAVESYLQKENKKVYFVHLGFAILWFICAFLFGV